LREILGFESLRPNVGPDEVYARIHPDDHAPYRAALRAHLRGETDIFQIEIRVLSDDHTVRWVLDRGVALRDETGRAYRMAGSVVDISERRHAEEELARYRTRLEELVAERTDALRATQADLLRSERLAALGELTAALSHELRNPLGTIHASFETLRRSLTPADEAGTRAVERVDRNIQRCVRVIEELLAYARVRNPVRTPVDLDGWLPDVLDRQRVPDGISLTCEVSTGAEVAIDEEQLRIAMDSVVRNAVQAIEARAALRPGASVRVRAHSRDTRARIQISDDGEGIGPDARARLFEPLFSTRSFGVGLGLAITRHILEQHGGDIEVDRTGVDGTTMALSLPAGHHAEP
jgi:signal transduction histidine kinase